MAVGGCRECAGKAHCECGPGGADPFGHQGFLPDKKGRADGGPADIPVAGQNFQRPPRPNMQNPYGINISNNYNPATSQGYSQSSNQGGSQGTNQSFNRSGSYVDPTKMGLYNQLLDLNKRNYNNVLGSYNQGQDELRRNLGNVYGQLPSIQNTLGMGQVLGKNGNWGVAQAGADAIAANQARGAGKITQGMTSAGLGNTTAVANLQNQNNLQANQAYGALGADLAGRAAAYQQQGLGMQMSGAGMQADAAWKMAGDLGRMNFANTFGNLDSNFSQGQSMGNNQSWNQGNSYSQNMSQGGGDYSQQQPAQQPPGGAPMATNQALNPMGGGWGNLFGMGQNPGAQGGGANAAGFFGGFGQGMEADPGFNPMGGNMNGWVGPQF